MPARPEACIAPAHNSGLTAGSQELFFNTHPTTILERSWAQMGLHTKNPRNFRAARQAVTWGGTCQALRAPV